MAKTTHGFDTAYKEREVARAQLKHVTRERDGLLAFIEGQKLVIAELRNDCAQLQEALAIAEAA